MAIHERLKSERERLTLSQTRLADLGGVGKTTVINWEKGTSSPDALQLAAFATAGMDVAYVLSGKTQQQRIEEAASGMPARLRALREERGIEAVLKVSGLTAKQWQKAEESEGSPTFPQGVLQRLIEGFSLDPMQFLTGQAEVITTNRTDETLLVKNYRACTPADQETIRQQAAFLAARGKSAPLTADGRYPKAGDVQALVLNDKPPKRGK